MPAAVIPRHRMELLMCGLAALSLLLTACGGSPSTGGAGGGGKTVTIGYQPGLMYAPLVVIKQQGSLEKDLPGYKVEWRQLNSGSALRDGQLSDRINIGAYGLGAFIVGWANGIDWRMNAALNDAEYALMVKDAKYQSLKDLKADNGKIAVPALDSPQAALIKKAALDDFGDATAYDANMVSLGHPDARQALMSGQIAAHFASVPFSYQEEEAGAREITNSTKLLGGVATGVGTVVKTKYAESHPDVMAALSKRLTEAQEMLTAQPEVAAPLLSQDTDGQPASDVYARYLREDKVTYTNVPHGLKAFADMMLKTKLIPKSPQSWQELTTDKLAALNGS